MALAVLEVLCLAAFAWFVPPLIDGGYIAAIFLAGVAFVVAWAATALHAYRRAIRLGRPFDVSGPDGGAADLLWLAPAAIVGMALLWAVGGTLARPESTLARYVHDWQAGDSADAARLFASPPVAAGLAATWESQLARLRNELVRLGAVGGGDEGFDPTRPFERVRFVDAEAASPAGSADAAPGSADASTGTATSADAVRRIAVQVARRDTVHDSFLGLFPTTSERLVTVSDLGWVELRATTRPADRAGVPDSPVWLVSGMDLLGARLGP